MLQDSVNLPKVYISRAEVLAGRLAAIQAQMALEHGPIFRCGVEDFFGSAEYVCLVGPEANRFVLHTAREAFSHDAGWTPIIGAPLGKGLLNMDPPQHTAHRKLWNPAFTTAAMTAYLPIINQVIRERTHTWLAQEEVDVLSEAREITFSAAALALAGFTSGPQVEALRQLFYQRDATHRGDQILLQLMAERRARLQHEQRHDTLSMILQARDDHGEPLSDEQILAHVNILLVAGHETTTTLSAWTLYLLAMMPEQRQRLEAELDDVVGDAPSPIGMEALRKLSHLDNFIKEVGRLYPPTLTVPRGVSQPVEFGGYRLPIGTPVRLGLAASHLLPQVFAEPHCFDPDRFAPPREEERRTPYGLVTFGGGARMCIGINFAQTETKALTTHVLRHYRLQAVAGQPVVHAGHLTALPGDGLQLRVTPNA